MNSRRIISETFEDRLFYEALSSLQLRDRGTYEHTAWALEKYYEDFHSNSQLTYVRGSLEDFIRGICLAVDVAGLTLRVRDSEIDETPPWHAWEHPNFGKIEHKFNDFGQPDMFALRVNGRDCLQVSGGSTCTYPWSKVGKEMDSEGSHLGGCTQEQMHA